MSPIPSKSSISGHPPSAGSRPSPAIGGNQPSVPNSFARNSRSVGRNDGPSQASGVSPALARATALRKVTASPAGNGSGRIATNVVATGHQRGASDSSLERPRPNVRTLVGTEPIPISVSKSSTNRGASEEIEC